jgi:hypothetical protein
VRGIRGDGITNGSHAFHATGSSIRRSIRPGQLATVMSLAFSGIH